MLSINQIKYIKSLSRKKSRNKYGEFIAEGEKIINELISYNNEKASCKWNVKKIFAYPDWINQFFDNKLIEQYELQELLPGELDRISSLSSPNKVLAIIEKKDWELSFPEINNSLSIYLDDIQDPGNLGTIIRIADWFGINNIFCSDKSVDLYNSKVIQGSMGSFCRVKVHNIVLESFINNTDNNYEVYGAFLEGENIYSANLSSNGLIILGNESKGINKANNKLINRKIYIPSFPSVDNKTNSLNVSVAASIICSEFRRRQV